MWYFLVAVIVTTVKSCHALPDGAPQSACNSMMPSHSGIEAQRNPPPYTVSAVKNGDKVKVTINSPTGEVIQGFVLQARSSSDENRTVNGKFSSFREAKTRDCDGGSQNMLTHISPEPKSEIVAEWTPAETINEGIVFRATVAKTFASFWTRIDSFPLRTEHVVTTQRMEIHHVIQEGCFVAKGCFGYPKDCVKRGDCEALVTYSRRVDGIFFAMYGYLEEGSYMAMGLSTDDKMGDDTVIELIRLGSNVVARESYNDGQSNARSCNMPRDTYHSNYVDGMSSCFLTLPFVLDANGKQYYLENETYHLLLAKGSMQGMYLSYHSRRIASQMPVNFTDVREIGAEPVTVALKNQGGNEETTVSAGIEHSKSSGSKPCLNVLFFLAALKLSFYATRRW